MTAKMKKAPVRQSDADQTPLAEIHFDVSGPFTETLGGNSYALQIIKPYTAKSDFFMIQKKSDVCQIVKEYSAHIENHFCHSRYKVQFLRCDRAGENLTDELKEYCANAGIEIKPSPAYAPESNGLAERLVQEHWTRARTIMFGTDLPEKLWGEAIKHANFLRNRVPNARINEDIPIYAGNPTPKLTTYHS